MDGSYAVKNILTEPVASCHALLRSSLSQEKRCSPLLLLPNQALPICEAGQAKGIGRVPLAYGVAITTRTQSGMPNILLPRASVSMFAPCGSFRASPLRSVSAQADPVTHFVDRHADDRLAADLAVEIIGRAC